ncbi:MAG: DUF2085 domain-containing protein [Ignavibacteria bacterium]
MKNFRNRSADVRNIPGKVYFSIITISLLWLILIFLAPLFASSGSSLEKISSYIYLFFSKVCHQNEDRTFHIFGHMLGVCSRCIWIYAGFFIGTAVYPFKKRLYNTEIPSLIYLFAAVIFLLLDVMLDVFGLFSNTFYSRSVTGFLIGAVLPFYIIPGFVKFFDEVHTFLRNKLSYKD